MLGRELDNLVYFLFFLRTMTSKLSCTNSPIRILKFQCRQAEIFPKQNFTWPFLLFLLKSGLFIKFKFPVYVLRLKSFCGNPDLEGLETRIKEILTRILCLLKLLICWIIQIPLQRPTPCNFKPSHRCAIWVLHDKPILAEEIVRLHQADHFPAQAESVSPHIWLMVLFWSDRSRTKGFCQLPKL